MPHDRGLQPNGSQGQESILVDGLLQNGTDRSAYWRAHVRELTVARQAAERRHTGPGLATGMDKPALLALARERAVGHVFGRARDQPARGALTRINAEHRIWMRAHGVVLAERPTRQRASTHATQQ